MTITELTRAQKSYFEYFFPFPYFGCFFLQSNLNLIKAKHLKNSLRTKGSHSLATAIGKPATYISEKKTAEITESILFAIN